MNEQESKVLALVGANGMLATMVRETAPEGVPDRPLRPSGFRHYRQGAGAGDHVWSPAAGDRQLRGLHRRRRLREPGRARPPGQWGGARVPCRGGPGARGGAGAYLHRLRLRRSWRSSLHRRGSRRSAIGLRPLQAGRRKGCSRKRAGQNILSSAPVGFTAPGERTSSKPSPAWPPSVTSWASSPTRWALPPTPKTSPGRSSTSSRLPEGRKPPDRPRAGSAFTIFPTKVPAAGSSSPGILLPGCRSVAFRSKLEGFCRFGRRNIPSRPRGLPTRFSPRRNTGKLQGRMFRTGGTGWRGIWEGD